MPSPYTMGVDDVYTLTGRFLVFQWALRIFILYQTSLGAGRGSGAHKGVLVHCWERLSVSPCPNLHKKEKPASRQAEASLSLEIFMTWRAFTIKPEHHLLCRNGNRNLFKALTSLNESMNPIDSSLWEKLPVFQLFPAAIEVNYSMYTLVGPLASPLASQSVSQSVSQPASQSVSQSVC